MPGWIRSAVRPLPPQSIDKPVPYDNKSDVLTQPGTAHHRPRVSPEPTINLLRFEIGAESAGATGIVLAAEVAVDLDAIRQQTHFSSRSRVNSA